MPFPVFDNIHQQTLTDNLLSEKGIEVNVLRLDKLHPVINGNKWFKLKPYLQDAIENGFDTVASFGGAWSNHIIALAHAGKELQLKTVGFIRGEEPANWSYTLLAAKEAGMQLIFLSRKEFDDEKSIREIFRANHWYWISEGGYGMKGAEGAATILDGIKRDHTHIVCAVGTGTMMAGLIKAAAEHQIIIGMNVLKGNDSIAEEVNALLNVEERKKQFSFINENHFGGYAKHPPELITFMQDLKKQHDLPTDIVYTSKMMYGLLELIKKDFFAAGSKVLAIHSGGLQGNLSLPTGVLSF